MAKKEKKKKREKQALKNQDVGIREFREMAVTQRGNERLVEISKIGHCTKKHFARNPFMHMLKGLQTGEEKKKRKKRERKKTQRGCVFFSGHSRFKRLSLVLKWLVTSCIVTWTQT